jgi:hypothetical protein
VQNPEFFGEQNGLSTKSITFAARRKMAGARIFLKNKVTIQPGVPRAISLRFKMLSSQVIARETKFCKPPEQLRNKKIITAFSIPDICNKFW